MHTKAFCLDTNSTAWGRLQQTVDNMEDSSRPRGVRGAQKTIARSSDLWSTCTRQLRRGSDTSASSSTPKQLAEHSSNTQLNGWSLAHDHTRPNDAWNLAWEEWCVTTRTGELKRGHPMLMTGGETFRDLVVKHRAGLSKLVSVAMRLGKEENLPCPTQRAHNLKCSVPAQIRNAVAVACTFSLRAAKKRKLQNVQMKIRKAADVTRGQKKIMIQINPEINQLLK